MNAPSRNQPCPCGSGRRYKACCGRLAGVADIARSPELADLMHAALDAQLARRLDEAERLYRDALALSPDVPDALHMLGVVRYERGDLAEARQLILRALDLTDWSIPGIRHNLGLVIARQYEARDREAGTAQERRYRAWVQARQATRRPRKPRISVVVPSYNHARYVGEALASVYAQSYRNVEIVVVDDGSIDGSPEVIAAALRDCPFPHRFVKRENHGAAATINDAIALASGDFVNVLNSDDRFPPTRLERMVDDVACIGAEWGFGDVRFIDADGRPLDPLRHRRVYDLTCELSAVPFRESVGMALLATNVTVSSGNLFVARALLDRLGAFGSYRYNHDWDFCLRAVLLSEPVFVPAPIYEYRLHETNTITESSESARAEAEGIGSAFLRVATKAAATGNPWAPTLALWGPVLLTGVLRSGMGALVEAGAMKALALQAIEDASPAEPIAGGG